MAAIIASGIRINVKNKNPPITNTNKPAINKPKPSTDIKNIAPLS